MAGPVAPKRDPRTVWTSEDPIDPVTDDNPLVGIETTANPRRVENLVRERVTIALDEEARAPRPRRPGARV